MEDMLINRSHLRPIGRFLGPKELERMRNPKAKGYGNSRAPTTGEKAKEGKGNKAGSAKGSYEHDFLAGIHRLSLLT